MAISPPVITHSGSSSISTLGGEIRIEEGRGRLVIYDPLTEQELTVIDRTGFLFSDSTDRRIKIGSYALRVGIWTSDPGEDVIDLLGG